MVLVPTIIEAVYAINVNKKKYHKAISTTPSEGKIISKPKSKESEKHTIQAPLKLAS